MHFGDYTWYVFSVDVCIPLQNQLKTWILKLDPQVIHAIFETSAVARLLITLIGSYFALGGRQGDGVALAEATEATGLPRVRSAQWDPHLAYGETKKHLLETSWSKQPVIQVRYPMFGYYWFHNIPHLSAKKTSQFNRMRRLAASCDTFFSAHWQLLPQAR